MGAVPDAWPEPACPPKMASPIALRRYSG